MIKKQLVPWTGSKAKGVKQDNPDQPEMCAANRIARQRKNCVNDIVVLLLICVCFCVHGCVVFVCKKC